MGQTPDQEKNPLKRLAQLVRSARQGDVVAAEVGEGARGVAVGKNIVQIGTLVVPLLPLLAILIALLVTAGAVAYLNLVPAHMPVDPDFPYFNVVIADFGQVEQDGRVSASDAGRRLSGYMYDALMRELQGLPDLQDRFKISVWNDSMSTLQKRVTIGAMASMTAAQQLAQDVGANVVIFGNFKAGQDANSFVPEFYVAPLHNEADEIVGWHQLGSPIERSGLNLRIELIDRQKLLTSFTVGLLYDLYGRQTDALKQFEAALQALRSANPDKPDQALKGAEVLQFFIGRENLYLERDVAAEQAFTASLQTNPDYARAHIGLGGVYYQRAERYEPGQMLDQPEWQQALAEYQRALEEAPQATGALLAVKARMGLGFTYALVGQSHLERGELADADQAYDQAITLIEQTLPDLQNQHRLLAQSYAVLGTAYGQRAAIPSENEAARALYTKSIESYDNCIKQGGNGGNPSDALLIDKVIEGVCRPNLDAVKRGLAELPQ
ncbi:MAG: hypothetical protein M1546_26915 [Chloroflexi bacterium]|nr:hypothetical protein [Chloroflexota bacterium]